MTRQPARNSIGETIQGWLQAAGIRTRVRVGARVDDIMATAIPGFYMSRYEDLELRRP